MPYSSQRTAAEMRLLTSEPKPQPPSQKCTQVYAEKSTSALRAVWLEPSWIRAFRSKNHWSSLSTFCSFSNFAVFASLSSLSLATTAIHARFCSSLNPLMSFVSASFVPSSTVCASCLGGGGGGGLLACPGGGLNSFSSCCVGQVAENHVLPSCSSRALIAWRLEADISLAASLRLGRKYLKERSSAACGRPKNSAIGATASKLPLKCASLMSS
mmetsp:Transcript_12034/g.34034  ORF Transcript_12034/g.34034 Transcript_12034/m.34034 type:complete len:214 (+) Transcript_12034:788-1429(+)